MIDHPVEPRVFMQMIPIQLRKFLDQRYFATVNLFEQIEKVPVLWICALSNFVICALYLPVVSSFVLRSHFHLIFVFDEESFLLARLRAKDISQLKCRVRR